MPHNSERQKSHARRGHKDQLRRAMSQTSTRSGADARKRMPASGYALAEHRR